MKNMKNINSNIKSNMKNMKNTKSNIKSNMKNMKNIKSNMKNMKTQNQISHSLIISFESIQELNESG